MTPLVDARSLTRGERLEVARRRDGLTQAQMAPHYDATRHVYQAWEADELDGAPRVAVGRLEPHEECVVLRRRRGVTRIKLASILGVSLTWVTEMERGRGAVDRLHTYWATREGRRQRRS